MERSLLLFPQPHSVRAKGEGMGRRGHSPKESPAETPIPGLAAGRCLKGWWKPGQGGGERERKKLRGLSPALEDAPHIGKNIGINRNCLLCPKIRQLCSCITPRVGVSSLGSVFSARAVLQCHSSPGVPGTEPWGQSGRRGLSRQLRGSNVRAESTVCFLPQTPSMLPAHGPPNS